MEIVIFLAFIVFCVIIRCIVKMISWHRKYTWLVNHGYERFIVGNDYGGAIIYAWRRNYFDAISETYIDGLSYRKFLKIMKD